MHMDNMDIIFFVLAGKINKCVLGALQDIKKCYGAPH